MSEWLVTDDLTVVLGLVLGAVVLLGNLYKPQYLVHPILLGRQSDVDRVRKKGESAVYRNYSTGLVGRLPMRPANDIRLLADLVKADFDESRMLYSTKITNSQLKARVDAVAKGLVKIVGLVPKESNALLLLNDGLEFLIADLALSTVSVPSFTLASPALLAEVLDSHPPDVIIVYSQQLSSLLELILDENEASNHKLIVLGDQGLPRHLDDIQKNVRIHMWADIEGEGRKLPDLGIPPPQPDDIFTETFYRSPDGQLRGTAFSHLNITAGVTSVRGVLNAGMTSADTVLSAHAFSTAYGRAIAYTALYEGASLATFAVPEGEAFHLADILNHTHKEFLSPTIIFLTTGQLQNIAMKIISAAKNSLAFPLSWRHKMSALQNGFVSNDTIWDRLSFGDARAAALGRAFGSLKNIVVDGTIDASGLTSIRIALSVPISHVFVDPCVAGPVTSSHMLDMQAFPSTTQSEGNPFDSIAHVGPPSINTEVKLVGVDDVSVEAGGSPVGQVLVRGPSVGKPTDLEVLPEQWVKLSARGTVLPNGTFKILDS